MLKDEIEKIKLKKQKKSNLSQLKSISQIYNLIVRPVHIHRK